MVVVISERENVLNDSQVNAEAQNREVSQEQTEKRPEWAAVIPVISAASAGEGAQALRRFLAALYIEEPRSHTVIQQGISKEALEAQIGQITFLDSNATAQSRVERADAVIQTQVAAAKPEIKNTDDVVLRTSSGENPPRKTQRRSRNVAVGAMQNSISQ